jgi:hypothetical protein
LFSSDALVSPASAIGVIQDEITETMLSGYSDATTERLLAREHERSALVEALLAGMTIDIADVWAAADALRIPQRGPFVMVAAKVPEIRARRCGRRKFGCARPAFIGLAAAARRARRHRASGLVHRLATVLAELCQQATRRVGVSPTRICIKPAHTCASPGSLWPVAARARIR